SGPRAPAAGRLPAGLPAAGRRRAPGPAARLPPARARSRLLRPGQDDRGLWGAEGAGAGGELAALSPLTPLPGARWLREGRGPVPPPAPPEPGRSAGQPFPACADGGPAAGTPGATAARLPNRRDGRG